jgi:ECF sigma factor
LARGNGNLTETTLAQASWDEHFNKPDVFGSGRSDRRTQRQESNCLRRVGPTHARFRLAFAAVPSGIQVGIPNDVRYRSKWQVPLEQLGRARPNGAAFVGELPRSFRRCAPGTPNRRASPWMQPLQPRAGSDNLSRMSEVTQILDAIGRGDAHASEQLLPTIYQELPRLAAKLERL